ncbi:MAG: hypothetical protein ACRENT_10775, partial [Thermodesulfobacteriota bacterium]
MLKINIKSRDISFICGWFLLILSPNPSFGDEDFGLGPLFHIDRDKAQESQEIDALGPFITSKKDRNRSEFGFRPLFYMVGDR